MKIKNALFLASVLTGFTGRLFAQAVNIFEPEPIRLPVQQANLGKVVFLADTIALPGLKNMDFLNHFEEAPGQNLYMRIFLGNSLTNYQHQIDTTLAVDQLNKGNFQFRFYVDGKQVYQENLNKNAGSALNKNTRTTISVPLVSDRGEDSWGRFLWLRFMNSGGEDALSTGSHVLKINVLPYIKNPDVKTGAPIASGELHYSLPKASLQAVNIQPIAAHSGWTISKEPYDQEKIRALNALIAQNRFKDITSIVVIKNGNLLIEEYFNGSARDSLHDPRSVGKTFASALTGIAIHDGYIKSESQTLHDFYHLEQFGNYSSRKETITLKSLLTMSSVFDGDDNDDNSPGNEEKMYPTADWVQFVLGLPLDSARTEGGQWHYFTGGAVLLGDVLNKVVPGGLEKYAGEKLFGPLGISRYQWKYTPQQVPNTAGGLQMRSLDFARFGQLYQNGGIWKGKQIIPESWVKKSFSTYLALPEDMVGKGYYGYFFWNKTYTVNDKLLETYYCSGNGGNKIFVFTNQPLVIIVTATAYNQPYAHRQVDKMMEQYILPAVMGK